MPERPLVDQRFRIKEKIGSGNFGEVWLANDEKTKTDVAVKIESDRSNNNQLFLEYRYYTLIHKQHRMPGFPFCYYFGPYLHANALVLELLGPSLEDLFDLCRHKFSPLTVFEIAKQTLRLIEVLHSKHIVHRDIKPENFLLGCSKQTMDAIYIIDLGLAKEYLDPITKQHIAYRENKNLTGTARYMSINTHLGKEQSRRDDIEALCHMYFYFLRGTLPWQGLKTENLKERYQKICQSKISTTVEALSRGFPDEFACMLRYARQLNFDQTPKYDYLINLIDMYMRKTNNVNHTPIYDWKPITDVG
uniref:non-specific serine/threonine protein kinase n=1 Tax=Myxobolus squamalis TaxID=59785 RepID=A0A6B2G3E2_MYXSQ